jgi:hypothetical protein
MKVLAWIVCPLLALILVGLLAPKSPPSAWDCCLDYSAKRAVEERLRDADSATFRNIFIRRTDNDDKRAACGEVNAKNAFGGFVGFTPFVVFFTRSGDQTLKSPVLMASDSLGGVSQDISAGAVQLACFGDPSQGRSAQTAPTKATGINNPPIVVQRQPVPAATTLSTKANSRNTVAIKSTANVRSGPSTSAAILRIAKAGEKFNTFNRANGWVQVGGESPEGWIAASLLDE